MDIEIIHNDTVFLAEDEREITDFKSWVTTHLQKKNGTEEAFAALLEQFIERKLLTFEDVTRMLGLDPGCIDVFRCRSKYDW